MRRLLVLVVLGGAVVIGTYLYLYKPDKLSEGYDAARGYPAAKNPKQAVDLFVKAIKARDYEYAAKYCTAAYAREMLKANKAAQELGKGVDNLASRLTDDHLMTNDLKLILFYLDPFPKQVGMVLSRETQQDAVATIRFDGIKVDGANP